VVEEAKEAGVERLISIGTSFKDNETVMKIAKEFDNVFCSFGIYPHEERKLTIEEIEKRFIAQAEKYLFTDERDLLKAGEKTSKSKLVAIGECGVDINPKEKLEWQRTLDEQLELFEMQLNLAGKCNLPIIIHNRNGDSEIIPMIKKLQNLFPKLTGVFHCFSQDWAFAKQVLDLGFYLSFSCMTTYPKKDSLHQVIKLTPFDKILVETDAPYLPPQSQRGQPNYPKNVTIVAEMISAIREVSYEKVCEITARNSCKLFNIPWLHN